MSVKEKSRGVSLITLVITIVVMIILAGVAFNTSSDSIDEAATTKIMQELSEVRKGTNAVRFANAKERY